MKKFMMAAGAMALMAGTIGAATSANAAVFATISGTHIKWQEANSVNMLPYSMLYGTGKSTLDFVPGGPGPLEVEFVFTPGTGDVSHQVATTTTVGNTVTYTQGGIQGGFEAIYFGKGKPIVVNGVTLTRGVTDIFDGTFSNGSIVARTVGGVAKPGHLTGVAGSFSSPLVTLPSSGAFSLDLTLRGMGSNWIVKGANQPLGTFNANGSGVFGSVPEPTSWALMLLGVGGIGAMVRRRKASAVAA